MPPSTARRIKGATASACRSKALSPDTTFDAETAAHAECIALRTLRVLRLTWYRTRREHDAARVLGLGDGVPGLGHNLPGHPHFARNNSTVSDGGDSLAGRRHHPG